MHGVRSSDEFSYRTAVCGANTYDTNITNTTDTNSVALKLSKVAVAYTERRVQSMRMRLT